MVVSIVTCVALSAQKKYIHIHVETQNVTKNFAVLLVISVSYLNHFKQTEIDVG